MRAIGVLGLLLGISLGCAGLMGYGTEMAKAPILSGQPFSLSWTTASPDPHQIWFDIDLNANTSSYGVQGTMATASSSWVVDLDNQGAPVVGGSGRMTMNWVEKNFGNISSARGTIYAVEIPAVPVGTAMTLSGTLTLAPGTTGRVEVIVTD